MNMENREELFCIPRILFTACGSGNGKTMLTCGFLRILERKGIRASSFKCGPDYIDPMFHSRFFGIQSRNLDLFFTGNEMTNYLFRKNTKESSIAVIEGAMGYYDGVGAVSTRASAYELSRVTNTPSVLVVQSRGMGTSLAALLRGFWEFRPDHRLRGVILNQVSAGLARKMQELLQTQYGIPVLGYIPNIEDFVMPSRHLGLLRPEEIDGFAEKVDALADCLEETLDIEGILSLACSAPDLPVRKAAPFTVAQAEAIKTVVKKKDSDKHREDLAAQRPVRIGVARDEAFCFLYEDNLDLLRELGAEPVFFSPLEDERLPEELDGLILYGGYPELYAGELEKNVSMKTDILEAIQGGLPCMAECGGFMYLHEHLRDAQNRSYRMVGAIPGETFYTGRSRRFGYLMLTPGQSVFGRELLLKPIPAHEFHYYDSENPGNAFHAKKPLSDKEWDCMYSTDTLLAGYPHLYYYACPEVAAAFIGA